MQSRPRSSASTSARWAVALVVTIGLAVFQRLTGPTHPLSGSTTVAGIAASFALERSHGGEGGLPVVIEVADPAVSGRLRWRPWPGDEPFSELPLARVGTGLQAEIPHHAPTKKVEYQAVLVKDGQEAEVPAAGQTIIARFKGAVPGWLLLPHILLMFGSMLVATRAGLEALLPAPIGLWRLSLVTTGLLFAGGMILGGFVALYAFGMFWTGVPFGWDVTDNKTLIAFLAWLAVLLAFRGREPGRGWVLLAAAIMLGVFLIPHSV